MFHGFGKHEGEMTVMWALAVLPNFNNIYLILITVYIYLELACVFNVYIMYMCCWTCKSYFIKSYFTHSQQNAPQYDIIAPPIPTNILPMSLTHARLAYH